jgi:hypothetical protein
MSHSCPKTGEEVLTILPPLRKELGKYVPVNLNREIHKMETLLTQKWERRHIERQRRLLAGWQRI